MRKVFVYSFFLLFLPIIIFAQQVESTQSNTKPDTVEAYLRKTPVDTVNYRSYYPGLQSRNIFSMPLGKFRKTWDDFRATSPTSEQFGKIYLNFQHSTAYTFTYADELWKHDNVKREYGNTAVMVPVVPMVVLGIYGAKAAYQAIEKDPPVLFDKTDLQIMQLIWNAPERSATHYYEQYNKGQHSAPLTFMTMHERIQKLVRQGLIETLASNVGIGKSMSRYAMKYDRLGLQQLLDAELLKAENQQNALRHSEVLVMKEML